MPKTLLHRYTSSPRAFPVLASLYPCWARGSVSVTSRRTGPAGNSTCTWPRGRPTPTAPRSGALLSGQLGTGYQVWTKSATIDFRTPGRGRLRCVVEVPRVEADSIREQLTARPRTSIVHTALVTDARGGTVVEARHTMSIRRRG
ncbi:DUF4442 domain-containing protein [Dietzia sp. KRD202]|uniref:DUF4442 domain-containing protein n=1 Tax=Dietzia sp. KRD202 TaxID=2729732 RepID=UPI0027DD8202|nr:DUF4442 domain-containing protein [Dietzia sp. KRD202]